MASIEDILEVQKRMEAQLSQLVQLMITTNQRLDTLILTLAQHIANLDSHR